MAGGEAPSLSNFALTYSVNNHIVALSVSSPQHMLIRILSWGPMFTPMCGPMPTSMCAPTCNNAHVSTRKSTCMAIRAAGSTASRT